MGNSRPEGEWRAQGSITRSGMHSIRVATILLIISTACATTGGGTRATTPQVGGSTTTPQPASSSESIAGEVTSAQEAFCAGFALTITEQPDSRFGDIDYSACMGADLAGEAGIDDTITDLPRAFAVGCGVVVASTLSEDDSPIPGDQLAELAFSVCYERYFDPQLWLPGDYVITIDGVCYLGLDTDDFPGCRDEAGALVTTTTLSFIAGDTAGYLAAVSGAAPAALALSTDADVALLYGQELCAEFTDWGGFDYAQWVVDVEIHGVGHESIPSDKWSQARAFIVEVPRIVTSHLCQDQAAAWQDSYEFRHEVFDVPNDTTFGGSIGEDVFYLNSDLITDIWDNQVPREVWQEIGLRMCEGLDAGGSVEAQRESVRDDIRAALSDGFGITLADSDLGFLTTSVANAALNGYCPRHSPWRWANLQGNFDPLSVP